MPGVDVLPQPNWAKIDQQLCEAYGYTLDQAWDLSLPEVAAMMSKLAATTGEPDWFVQAWRGGGNPEAKLIALKRLLE
jgi:hypothetical protein